MSLLLQTSTTRKHNDLNKYINIKAGMYAYVLHVNFLIAETVITSRLIASRASIIIIYLFIIRG